MRVFQLGNMTFGGTILFETKDEICVLMVGDWQTIRVPKTHAAI